MGGLLVAYLKVRGRQVNERFISGDSSSAGQPQRRTFFRPPAESQSQNRLRLLLFVFDIKNAPDYWAAAE